MKVRDESILPPHKSVSNICKCPRYMVYYLLGGQLETLPLCQFKIQRSTRCLDGQRGAISAQRLLTTVLQVTGGTLVTSLGTFGMQSLRRECLHSLLDLTFMCPSLCCQISTNHSSQYWFHSPSQPLNSSWNIFLRGQIDGHPSCRFLRVLWWHLGWLLYQMQRLSHPPCYFLDR